MKIDLGVSCVLLFGMVNCLEISLLVKVLFVFGWDDVSFGVDDY